MKLKVTHKGGGSEVITLSPGAVIVDPDHKYQNRITDPKSGMEYFFNLDGTYDGWQTGCSREEAEGIIKILEAAAKKQAN
jgi:hypothetical protein